MHSFLRSKLRLDTVLNLLYIKFMEVHKMKEFSEYKTSDEFVLDLVGEGLIMYTKAGHLVLPARPRKPNPERVENFMLRILEVIARSPDGKVRSSLMMKVLRGDNHPDEFAIAVRRLTEERKISVEKMVTKDIGRPCVYYRLFEF